MASDHMCICSADHDTVVSGARSAAGHNALCAAHRHVERGLHLLRASHWGATPLQLSPHSLDLPCLLLLIHAFFIHEDQVPRSSVSLTARLPYLQVTVKMEPIFVMIMMIIFSMPA